MPRHRTLGLGQPALLLIAGALLGPGSAAGHIEEAADAKDPRTKAATNGEEAAKPDPCRPEAEGESWIDAVNDGIFRTVCGTARWFDGLFGDARFDEEAEETWGRLSVETIHDEYDGFEARLRFRAEVKFPNLENRVDAFFGREIEEEYVRGRDDSFEPRPEFFREDAERDWLVGLGYHPVRGNGSSNRVDFQVGVKIRFPLEPFVQGRFRRHWFLSNGHLVRFRNTAFWRNQRGFGNTATLDLEQLMARSLLLRWTTSGTFSESTEGLDAYSGLTLFQSLGGFRALAWTAYVDVETDRATPVERFGLRAIYRQKLHRPWLHGRLIGGVSFPRDLGDDRETSWELGVGIEMRYGHPATGPDRKP